MARRRIKSHPIDVYCDALGISKRELARQSGLSAATVCAIASGREQCGAEAARKLYRATGGEISCDDLLLFGEAA